VNALSPRRAAGSLSPPPAALSARRPPATPPLRWPPVLSTSAGLRRPHLSVSRRHPRPFRRPPILAASSQRPQPSVGRHRPQPSVGRRRPQRSADLRAPVLSASAGALSPIRPHPPSAGALRRTPAPSPPWLHRALAAMRWRGMREVRSCVTDDGLAGLVGSNRFTRFETKVCPGLTAPSLRPGPTRGYNANQPQPSICLGTTDWNRCLTNDRCIMP
jgi:hypothetical protein